MRQFGEREEGWTYVDRRCAYALATDGNGLLLCVRAKGAFHLPGGGLRDGETAERGLLRELLEETGREGEVTGRVGEASQYVVARAEGRAFNKLGEFFSVRILRRTGGPTDHEPVWLPVERAARELAPEFQRWMVLRTLAQE